MSFIFQSLIRNPLVRAQVLAQVHNLLGIATGALALWFFRSMLYDTLSS